MKKLITLLTLGLIILINVPAISQVSINTNGTDPDGSAMLDVESTTSGMLVPRMTQTERNAINGGTFATGLLIYQTDNTPGFYYYDGSAWQMIVGGDDGDWTLSGNDMYNNNSGNVVIGTPAPKNEILTLRRDVDDGTRISIYNLSTESEAFAGLKLFSATADGGLSVQHDTYTGTYGLFGHTADRFLLYSSTNSAGISIMPLSSSGDVRIYSGGYLSTNERLRITSGGNVGIGTTNPQRRLHISDVMRLEPSSAPSNPSEGDLYVNSNHHIYCYLGGCWKQLD